LADIEYADDLSEDELDREAVEAETSPNLETPPAKRPRGRPKGLGKVPGSGRIKGKPTKRQTQEELRGKLWSVADEVFEFHLSVMRGELQKVSGPTGKQMWAPPTLAQRMESAQYLGHKMVPDLKSSEVLQANINASANLDGATRDDITKAILDAIGARHTEPTPLLIEAGHGDNAETADDSTPESDDNGITHFTDVEQIKRWDAERPAPSQGSSNTGKSKTFPNGYGWEKRFDEARRMDIYDLYNSGGQLCGHRRSQERADAWCESEGSA
jgi:hypothetical protein